MSIPPAFVHLVDDAAIFPPGLAPLPEAVRAHAAHLAAPYAALVGPFVVDADRLDALVGLDDPAAVGLRVAVVVPTPAQVADVVARADRAGLVLAALEVRTGDGDPAAAVATLAAATPPGVTSYVEAPRPGSPGWPVVLDAVVAHGLRLKLRTGGTEAEAFPSEAEVATWVGAAVQHGVAFKCTAGLHHAVRHTGPVTGFEHHGYLNVLLATARALAGAPLSDVTAALAERDPATVAAAVSALTAAETAAARAAFTSYGSCSILEPLDDLTALDLLQEHA